LANSELIAAKEKLVPILYECECTKSRILDSKAIGKIVIGAAPRLRRGFGGQTPPFRFRFLACPKSNRRKYFSDLIYTFPCYTKTPIGVFV